MLVFLLLLLQSWHARDAQEGVVGIPIPHQQLLVRRDHLYSLVEDAGANLYHFQVLLLLIPGTLDIGHPASVVFLAGIDEVAYRAILIEYLGTSGAVMG